MSLNIPSFSPPEKPDDRSILDSVIRGALNSLRKNFFDDNNSSENSQLQIVDHNSYKNHGGIDIPDFTSRDDSSKELDNIYNGPKVLRSDTNKTDYSDKNIIPSVLPEPETSANIDLPSNNANLTEKMNYLQKVASKRTIDGINELKINPPFQKKVINFVYDSFKAGHKIEITDALRTNEEQRRNVARWVSKTMNSKHLIGEAIDIIYPAYKGNKKYEIPVAVRQIAAKNGLWNGGDMWGWDYPHFQDKPSGASRNDLAKMTRRGTNPLDYSNIA